EVAVDAAGNIYVTDDYYMVVRKIAAGTGIISTFAGNGTAGYTGDGGPATSAELNTPRGLAVDGAGNLYIADLNNSVVRMVTASTGVITTVAGSDSQGYSGDGGQASGAKLAGPSGVASDSAGNLYISDQWSSVVRKVSVATGIITTVAGNGSSGYSGDGRAATSATLDSPENVVVDAAGDLYIADTGNNVIRKIAASTGIITTFAGNGTAGYGGDAGQATAAGAELNVPFGVALDGAGNLYISDWNNNVIRMVTASTGVISTVVGNGTAGFAGDGGPATSAELNGPLGVAVDGAGDIYLADSQNQRVRTVNAIVAEPNTTTPAITWTSPSTITYGVALNRTQLNATTNVSGSFIYTPASGTVLNVGLQSLSVTFVPTDTTHYNVTMATVSLTVIRATPTITWTPPTPITLGTALSAIQLNATANVAGTFAYAPSIGTVLGLGSQSLTVTFTPTDTTDYNATSATVTLTVSLLPSAGTITTVAGSSSFGYAGDGGAATSAAFGEVGEVAVDAAGNIYVTDDYYMVVRKIAAGTGIISTFAGNGAAGYTGDGGAATSAELNVPRGLAVDGAGNLYIADLYNSVVRMVTASTGVITTVAGSGSQGYSGDGGPASGARLVQPSGVALDPAGNLYISDQWSSVVRKVTASTGIITTVAGNGSSGYSGDGGAATSATLDTPENVVVDAAGNLYIADSGNNAIRKVAASTGIITTFAGNGTAGYGGDGGQATAAGAELNVPFGVALDGAGNLYISDWNNNVIRMVATSTGVISTVVGNGTAGFSGDGGPPTRAELNGPLGVAADGAGDIFMADSGNQRVRAVGVVETVTLLSKSTAVGAAGSVSATSTAVLSTNAVKDTFSNGQGRTSGPIAISNGNASASIRNANWTRAVYTITVTALPSPNQTISFTAPASPTNSGVSPIALSATARSGRPVVFSAISGPGTIGGNMLTITGASTVVVAANQAGKANYTAAPQFTQSVVVNASSQASYSMASPHVIIATHAKGIDYASTQAVSVPSLVQESV
ncbi:MAG: hypothetical protein WBQ94_16445, partial [Terracidiphilus sp.]